MLKSLYIQNYAIIDELRIVFSSRLNVITGETGAGKSILMGALSLILGERADSSMLLTKERKCIVEGVFSSQSGTVAALLREHELEDEGTAASGGTGGSAGAPNEIIIRREIAINGKSRAFVNDTPVTLELLRQISLQLVDLHRQFDTLSISDSGFQRNVLDALAGNRELLAGYRQAYSSWRTLHDELRILKLQKAEFNKEHDYVQFLFDELEEAKLTENLYEDAEAELKLLSNAETIREGFSHAAGAITVSDQSLVQQLRQVHHQLNSISKFHNGAAELAARLSSVQIELQDIGDEAESLSASVSYEPSRLDELNEKISEGYKLFKKHSVNSTAGLISIHEELNAKLQSVLNTDARIETLEKEERIAQEQLQKLAASLSAKRQRQVKPFTSEVNRLLARVGMPNAKLQVLIEKKDPDMWGADDIEFLFDANNSGKFEPVKKVASGGELSRLMLSIKSLVAESMDMPTLIFDEIDSGISGEAARQVGEIMSGLSQSRQVITITHQPQIAGRGQTHLFVYKEIRNDAVRTGIRELAHEERILTIAKMLAGEKPTPAALENAREMVMN